MWYIFEPHLAFKGNSKQVNNRFPIFSFQFIEVLAITEIQLAQFIFIL